MCRSMVDIQSETAEIRRGIKKIDRNHRAKIYCPHLLRRAAITRMSANAQRDGRPDEYRWYPLFSTAVLLTSTTRVPHSNAAKMINPLKLVGVPQTNETTSAASGPKFTIL